MDKEPTSAERSSDISQSMNSISGLLHPSTVKEVTKYGLPRAEGCKDHPADHPRGGDPPDVLSKHGAGVLQDRTHQPVIKASIHKVRSLGHTWLAYVVCYRLKSWHVSAVSPALLQP